MEIFAWYSILGCQFFFPLIFLMYHPTLFCKGSVETSAHTLFYKDSLVCDESLFIAAFKILFVFDFDSLGIMSSPFWVQPIWIIWDS